MLPDHAPQENSTLVRIANNLSEAIDRLEERIRERAYNIFLRRDPAEGDPLKDWLEARMEVLTPIDFAIKDQKKNVVVEGNLKGFKPGEVEVEVSGGELTVFGSHADSTSGVRQGVTESTSSAVHFYEVLPLPCEVDADAVDARFLKNGKLKITLPKTAVRS